MLLDPVGLRPAQNRYWDGHIGEYEVSNKRTVWVTWVPCSRTHTHIVIWDVDKIVEKVDNICRLQAAKATEDLLQQL